MYNLLSNFRARWIAVKRNAARNTRKRGNTVKSVQRSKDLFLSLIFSVVVVGSVNGQSIELSAGFNRSDYQVGIGYGHQVERFLLVPKVELGVNSTFASGRLFPRISIGTTYFALKKNRFELGPELTYAYSRQRLTTNHKSAHHWNELNLGYRLQFGERIKFVHALSGGWFNEFFKSETAGKIVSYHSLGYYAQIGISYTF